jgi:hypothetical protein
VVALHACTLLLQYLEDIVGTDRLIQHPEEEAKK